MQGVEGFREYLTRTSFRSWMECLRRLMPSNDTSNNSK